MICRFIELTEGQVAIVDEKHYDRLMKYKWRAVKYKRSWYAKTDVFHYNKRTQISMHRMVANTPKHLVCHHLDGNSLDNREKNLMNMTKAHHTAYHQQNNVKVKYETPDRPA